MESNEFPPLPNTSILGPIPASQNGSFAKNLANPSASKEDFPVSFVRPNKKFFFKGDDLSEGISVWSFSLIGYSLGPRPYYERLLTAMKKVWILKGSFSLLSLADGFFLIKFSNQEDFDLVWSGGPWFMLGKPFILQKWSPKFQPKRDELSEIPLWIKIVDFPLALWTPKGISTIASYIGNPLSVDTLTAKRARLTYARVCVAISKDSSLPEEIPINIEGEDIMLKVIYDWKPSRCEGCGSLVHSYGSCKSNPNPEPVVLPLPKTKNRGRSQSRNPRPQTQAPVKATPPPEKVISAPAKATNPEIVNLESINRNVNNFPNLTPAPEKEFTPQIQNNCIGKDAIIPNLNAPIEETSSSGQPSIPSEIPPAKVMLSNKFSALQTDEPPDVELEDIGSVSNMHDFNLVTEVSSSQISSGNKNQTSPISMTTRAKSARKGKNSKY
ncbi:RNA exonuclease 1 [Dendrobium catenatum]|uniref:RNA exonuclease 1 n=1 Tax=Dendrobium catenatum TaxID=906689 RepID=A0A2I0W6S7_9ASPA|nr:RNA exonuclease 1 [Dendrobium catenatum]